MTEKDWDRFSGLVDKIMELEGTWEDKKKLVEEKMEVRGSLTNLEELSNWFAE